MYKRILFVILVLTALLSACAPAATEVLNPTEVDKVDNFHRTKDLNLYDLTLKISRSDVLGNEGAVYWVGEEGLLRGEVESLSPSISDDIKGKVIIVKTTDFRTVGLQARDKVDLICTIDYDVICTKLSTSFDPNYCYETWEFQNCRMKDFHPSN